MYQLEKEHRFEAAHRLVYGYEGKCAHVHGHSWVVKFICAGSKLDDVGMLRDFASFKDFRGWIDDNLDHATMVSDTDGALLGFLKENNQRHFVVSGNPTSETLARFLYNVGREQFGLADLTAVVVEETCTSRCTFHE